jgi:hypothetical protein
MSESDLGGVLSIARINGRLLAENRLEDGLPHAAVRCAVMSKLIAASVSWEHSPPEKKSILAEYRRGVEEVLAGYGGPEHDGRPPD